MRDLPGRGPRRRLVDPEGIAIDANHIGVRRQRAGERLCPMANPATDVKHVAHPIKAKPASGQLDVVGVPPEVAGVAEIFSRMRVYCPKFVAHGIRSASIVKSD